MMLHRNTVENVEFIHATSSSSTWTWYRPLTRPRTLRTHTIFRISFDTIIFSPRYRLHPTVRQMCVWFMCGCWGLCLNGDGAFASKDGRKLMVCIFEITNLFGEINYIDPAEKVRIGCTAFTFCSILSCTHLCQHWAHFSMFRCASCSRRVI